MHKEGNLQKENRNDSNTKKKSTNYDYEKAEDCLQEALESGLWEQIMGVTLKDEDIEPARKRLLEGFYDDKEI